MMMMVVNDDKPGGGPVPSSSVSEQKSNTIYEVDATSYDGDDEEESDFTRFYKQSEPKCSIDQKPENTNTMKLKIEDIGVDEEIDVMVEEATVVGNIVNYADSDDKDSTTRCSTADNDSQFDNRVEDNERKEVEESESLPKPFAYDVVLKTKSLRRRSHIVNNFLRKVMHLSLNIIMLYSTINI